MLSLTCVLSASYAAADKNKNDKKSEPAKPVAAAKTAAPKAAPNAVPTKAVPAAAPATRTVVRESKPVSGVEATEHSLPNRATTATAHEKMHSGPAEQAGVRHDTPASAAPRERVSGEGLHPRMTEHSSREVRAQALERSTAERSRFARANEPIRLARTDRVVLTHLRIVPSTYHYRREVFYGTYGWRSPDYVYQLRSHYGLWDTTFLAFALDHVADEQYALMLYNHQSEPAFQQWMQDTDRLAVDDLDLRAQLHVVKQQMASLGQSGRSPDPSYVPADAQDLALAPEVIEETEAPEGRSPAPGNASGESDQAASDAEKALTGEEITRLTAGAEAAKEDDKPLTADDITRLMPAEPDDHPNANDNQVQPVRQQPVIQQPVMQPVVQAVMQQPAAQQPVMQVPAPSENDESSKTSPAKRSNALAKEDKSHSSAGGKVESGTIQSVDGQYVRWNRGLLQGIRPGQAVRIVRQGHEVGRGRAIDVRTVESDVEIDVVTGVAEIIVGDEVQVERRARTADMPRP
jgi:hypothetical protein